MRSFPKFSNRSGEMRNAVEAAKAWSTRKSGKLVGLVQRLVSTIAQAKFRELLPSTGLGRPPSEQCGEYHGCPRRPPGKMRDPPSSRRKEQEWAGQKRYRRSVRQRLPSMRSPSRRSGQRDPKRRAHIDRRRDRGWRAARRCFPLRSCGPGLPARGSDVGSAVRPLRHASGQWARACGGSFLTPTPAFFLVRGRVFHYSGGVGGARELFSEDHGRQRELACAV
jgi:hypothetical protein